MVSKYTPVLRPPVLPAAVSSTSLACTAASIEMFCLKNTKAALYKQNKEYMRAKQECYPSLDTAEMQCTIKEAALHQAFMKSSQHSREVTSSIFVQDEKEYKALRYQLVADCDSCLHRLVPGYKRMIAPHALPTPSIAHSLTTVSHRSPMVSMQQNDGYLLPSGPFLKPDGGWKNPNNIQKSLDACKAQCASLGKCDYGTFITAGARTGECWLSALRIKHSDEFHAHNKCGVPCRSFRRRGSK
jgi:hypothetical protein